MVLAKLGAKRVFASETDDCVRLTRANIELNDVADRTTAVTYYWGQKQASPFEENRCGLVVASDLLFISLRDNLEDSLLSTLCGICTAGTVCLFAYEEREIEREARFMARLAVSCTERGGKLIQLSEGNFDFSVCKSHGDLSDLFYTPPPVLFYAILPAGN